MTEKKTKKGGVSKEKVAGAAAAAAAYYGPKAGMVAYAYAYRQYQRYNVPMRIAWDARNANVPDLPEPEEEPFDF